MKHRILLTLTLLIAFAVMGSGKRVIKVLAIGNSFSEDAVEQYLYELAAAQGPITQARIASKRTKGSP